MNNIVYLMNSYEFPVLGTHYFCMKKFIKGFEENNFIIKEAKHIDDLTNNSIVIISSHSINNNDFISNLILLANKFPDCIYICWYFHKIYNYIPFKKFILTGEHFHKKPKKNSHIIYWEIQNNVHNFYPLTFAANLKENIVGTLTRRNIYDACFIGSTYKYDWIHNLHNIIYLGSNKWTPENPIKEEDRIQYFLDSKICLGFHSEDNIMNNVVTERVYEGMAYGCVVISDNPIAHEITNGIVQIATNKNDFNALYHKLLNNDDICKDLQKRGYEWVKQHGLYKHVTKGFLNNMKELNFI